MSLGFKESVLASQTAMEAIQNSTLTGEARELAIDALGVGTFYTDTNRFEEVDKDPRATWWDKFTATLAVWRAI